VELLNVKLAVHIVTTVFIGLSTLIFTVQWLLHLWLHVGFHVWRFSCFLLSSSRQCRDHSLSSNLLLALFLYPHNLAYSLSSTVHKHLAWARIRALQLKGQRFSGGPEFVYRTEKLPTLHTVINSNSLCCRCLLKYRCWILPTSLTENTWGCNILLIGGYSMRMNWTFYSPVVTICTAQWSLYVPPV
jgi:hypothetical protein